MQHLEIDEILLINNLMYIPAENPLRNMKGNESKTVKEWLNTIEIAQIVEDKDYGSFITGLDYKRIIAAVKKNSNIASMKIIDTHKDNSEGGGGGFSALLISQELNEAVVAFRGTAANEWKDNFRGGGMTDSADRVSTRQQENALLWYKEIYQKYGLDKYYLTITGHSKGGNKSKYITILDDTVDRCLSFDGQGFSDEFIDTYTNRIVERQNIIENHNVDYDYVNLLLNDIGETHYYEGYQYGKAGFLENHCPNTFFDMKDDGSYIIQMLENGRPEAVKELDKFLNSYLRSLKGDDKRKALEIVGTLVEGGFSGTKKDFIKNIMFDLKNEKSMTYLLAYLIKYEQATPGFLDSIRGLSEELGLIQVIEYVDIIDSILAWKYFDQLYDFLDGTLGIAIKWKWLVNKLLILIKRKKRIKLSQKGLAEVLGVLGRINDSMEDITIKKNSGEDRVIEGKVRR